VTLTASLIATFPWQGGDINIVVSLLMILTECAWGLAPTMITTEHGVHILLAWPVKGYLIRYSIRSRYDNFTSLRFVITSVSLRPVTPPSSLVMKWCKSLTPLKTAQATIS